MLKSPLRSLPGKIRPLTIASTRRSDFNACAERPLNSVKLSAEGVFQQSKTGQPTFMVRRNRRRMSEPRTTAPVLCPMRSHLAGLWRRSPR